MDIVFVRHTSVAVERGVCYGRSDVTTADTFEEEALMVKNRLEEFGEAGRVFTSPLSRCTSLAAKCGYPDAIKDDRLLELNFGEWELKKFDDIGDPRLQEWYDDYLHVAPTGGESFPEQMSRVSDFIEELKKSGISKATVFAHGGVLLCAMVLAGRVKLEEAMSSIPPFGSVVRLDF